MSYTVDFDNQLYNSLSVGKEEAFASVFDRVVFMMLTSPMILVVSIHYIIKVLFLVYILLFPL